MITVHYITLIISFSHQQLIMMLMDAFTVDFADPFSMPPKIADSSKIKLSPLHFI